MGSPIEWLQFRLAAFKELTHSPATAENPNNHHIRPTPFLIQIPLPAACLTIPFQLLVEGTQNLGLFLKIDFPNQREFPTDCEYNFPPGGVCVPLEPGSQTTYDDAPT